MKNIIKRSLLTTIMISSSYATISLLVGCRGGNSSVAEQNDETKIEEKDKNINPKTVYQELSK